MMTVDSAEAFRDETVDYYYYLSLVSARERIEAFRSAVHTVVQHGDIVVEIGAGLGTYSFFAAQAGAGHVYAIERERVMQVAEELARRNGLAERVTFVRGESTDVVLPAKGDVLIVEDFSSLFVRRSLEETVRDALDRHVREGASIIPHAVSLYLAPVEEASLWAHLVNGQHARGDSYGLDLQLLREILLHSPHVRAVEPDALLAQPRRFKVIELADAQDYLWDEVHSAEITRSGTLHGLVGWFDLHLTPDLLLSNAPGRAESVWRQVFFPFATPLEVRAGETVILRLACARSTRTRDVWWTWQARTASGSSHNSSFEAIPLPPDSNKGGATF